VLAADGNAGCGCKIVPLKMMAYLGPLVLAAGPWASSGLACAWARGAQRLGQRQDTGGCVPQVERREGAWGRGRALRQRRRRTRGGSRLGRVEGGRHLGRVAAAGCTVAARGLSSAAPAQEGGVPGASKGAPPGARLAPAALEVKGTMGSQPAGPGAPVGARGSVFVVQWEAWVGASKRPWGPHGCGGVGLVGPPVRCTIGILLVVVWA